MRVCQLCQLCPDVQHAVWYTYCSLSNEGKDKTPLVEYILRNVHVRIRGQCLKTSTGSIAVRNSSSVLKCPPSSRSSKRWATQPWLAYTGRGAETATMSDQYSRRLLATRGPCTSQFHANGPLHRRCTAMTTVKRLHVMSRAIHPKANLKRVIRSGLSSWCTKWSDSLVVPVTTSSRLL